VVSNDGLTFTESTLDTFVGGENLRKYSNEFNTASWSINNFNAAENNNIANPVDGAVDSIKLVASDTGGAARHEFYTHFNQANSTQYTQSIYIKPFGLVTHLRGSEGGATSRGAAFDLINSQVITNGGMGNQGATIEDLGNGWRRVIFTYTSAYANTNNRIYWSVGDASSDTFGSSVHQNFNPGQGSGVYVWGGQVNLGTTAKAPTKTEAIIREGNASVVVLYNQTGGEDAIQSTTDYQPFLYKAGLLVRSGTSPAIEFLQTSPSYSNLEMNGINADRLDAWFVADTSSTQYIYPSQHDNGGRHGWIGQDGNSNVQAHLNYGGEPVRLYANGSLVGGYDITRDAVHTGLNGRKLVHHQDADTADWSTIQVGWYGQGAAVSSHIPWGYEGKMSEMVFFDSNQSSNKTAIEADINDFHNLF